MPDATGLVGDPGPRPHPAVLAGSRAIRRVLIALVRLYQVGLGWLLGGQCRFVPSCSHYALDALRSKPAWKAIGLIAWRLARCQPLCKGGFDDVPTHPSDVWWRIEAKGACCGGDAGG